MTALAAKREIYPARVKKDFTVRVKGGVIIYPGAKVAMKGGLLQPIDENGHTTLVWVITAIYALLAWVASASVLVQSRK